MPAEGCVLQRWLYVQETLSIELTCTNQNLPSQLAIGDICQLSEEIEYRGEEKQVPVSGFLQ